MAQEFIRVRVTGKGLLKKYILVEEAAMSPGSAVSDLVMSCHIPAGHNVICIRGSNRLQPEDKLNDGDSVIMVSMMAGG